MEPTHNKATIFKSIGDETRLEIIRKLAREDKEVNGRDIVSDCAIALKLSQPTMSYHFQTLVSAGVLLERKVGVEKYYQLNQPLLGQVGINTDKL